MIFKKHNRLWMKKNVYNNVILMRIVNVIKIMKVSIKNNEFFCYFILIIIKKYDFVRFIAYLLENILFYDLFNIIILVICILFLFFNKY